MTTFKNIERIVIITQDLKLNRTATARYLSFLQCLKNHGHRVKGLGVDFKFKPHPINKIDKTNEVSTVESDILTAKTTHLNFVQNLISQCDRFNFPFFIKKYLLALHIVIYKTDQWQINLKDLAMVDDFKPTVIISGGSGGVIRSAYQLARKHNARFIIDYRDPLNFGYNLLETNKVATWLKKRFTLKAELEMLSAADHIITVSESLKSFFPKEFKSKVSIIENGCNFEQYEFIDKIVANPTTFNIVYLGTLYNEQLDDEYFFESVRDFLVVNKIESKYFRIRFLGSSQNKRLPNLLKKFELENYTEITDRLDKDNLMKLLVNASLFLHLKYGDRSQIISSKQADYLMFRRPILLPATDNGDIAESIVKNKAGYVCDGSVKSITAALQTEFDKFLRGETNVMEDRDLSCLTRSKIAEKLLEIIP